MQIPQELKYTKEHEWLRIEDGTVVIGITEYAQQELGDIVFIELPEPGRDIKKGETLCVIESTKAASDVFAPVTGVVKEVNNALKDSPESVNSSPYQSGWLVKLADVASADFDQLMDAGQYQTFLESRSNG